MSLLDSFFSNPNRFMNVTGLGGGGNNTNVYSQLAQFDQAIMGSFSLAKPESMYSFMPSTNPLSGLFGGGSSLFGGSSFSNPLGGLFGMGGSSSPFDLWGGSSFGGFTPQGWSLEPSPIAELTDLTSLFNPQPKAPSGMESLYMMMLMQSQGKGKGQNSLDDDVFGILADEGAAQGLNMNFEDYGLSDADVENRLALISRDPRKADLFNQLQLKKLETIQDISNPLLSAAEKTKQRERFDRITQLQVKLLGGPKTSATDDSVAGTTTQVKLLGDIQKKKAEALADMSNPLLTAEERTQKKQRYVRLTQLESKLLTSTKKNVGTPTPVVTPTPVGTPASVVTPAPVITPTPVPTDAPGASTNGSLRGIADSLQKVAADQASTPVPGAGSNGSLREIADSLQKVAADQVSTYTPASKSRVLWASVAYQPESYQLNDDQVKLAEVTKKSILANRTSTWDISNPTYSPAEGSISYTPVQTPAPEPSYYYSQPVVETPAPQPSPTIWDSPSVAYRSAYNTVGDQTDFGSVSYHPTFYEPATYTVIDYSAPKLVNIDTRTNDQGLAYLEKTNAQTGEVIVRTQPTDPSGIDYQGLSWDRF